MIRYELQKVAAENMLKLFEVYSPYSEEEIQKVINTYQTKNSYLAMLEACNQIKASRKQ